MLGIGGLLSQVQWGIQKITFYIYATLVRVHFTVHYIAQIK